MSGWTHHHFHTLQEPITDSDLSFKWLYLYHLRQAGPLKLEGQSHAFERELQLPPFKHSGHSREIWVRQVHNHNTQYASEQLSQDFCYGKTVEDAICGAIMTDRWGQIGADHVSTAWAREMWFITQYLHTCADCKTCFTSTCICIRTPPRLHTTTHMWPNHSTLTAEWTTIPRHTVTLPSNGVV